jgi:hypothetical protein
MEVHVKVTIWKKIEISEDVPKDWLNFPDNNNIKI